MGGNFCPYYKDKEVFKQFNQIITALGGKPMSEEEFKSGELRNQRSGLDYSAMEAAYRMWELNNGHSYDKAPNGEKSIIFDQLLRINNNDIDAAIKAKSAIYTQEFANKYGDWLDLSLNKNADDKTRSKKINLDKNGEPSLTKEKNDEKKVENHFGDKFKTAYPEDFFGYAINNMMMNGNPVHSAEIIDRLVKQEFMSDYNVDLAKLLSQYDIPVKFETIDEPQDLMQFVTGDKERYIAIDPIKLSNVSIQYAGDSFLHEVVHHIVEDTLSKPKNDKQEQFKKLNHDLWSYFNEKFPADKYDRNDVESGFYALTNEFEFAAEFMVNRATREFLFQQAKKQYYGNDKSVLKKIVRYVKQFFKALFGDNESILKDLKRYQKMYEDYVYNNKVFKPEVPTSQLYQEVYNHLNQNNLNEQLILDNQKKLFSRRAHVIMPQIENGELRQGIQDDEKEAQRKINKMSTNIVSTLNKRLAAVLTSNLSPQLKSRLSQELQMQMQQFQSEQVNKYDAIITLLSQIAPQLTEDIKALERLNKNNMLTTDTFYMYNKHDYFGAYNKVLDEIEQALNNDSVVKLLCGLKGDEKDDEKLEDITRFYEITKKCKSKVDTAISTMNQILLRNVKRDLANIANETNSPNLAKFIEQIDNYGIDINWFTQSFGDISKTDNQELKSLAYLVNKANNEAEEASFNKQTELLKLQEALKSGESLQDLYEKDGKYATGYLVRKYNYGKFYNDYNNFMDKLNMSLGLDPKNRLVPDNDDIRIEWQTKKNDWLSEHCERKFVKEYYDAFIHLSQETREAYDLLQNQIRVIKQKCYHEDTGYYYYDELSKQDWDDLDDLYAQKRRLASPRLPDGSKKREDTVEYKIYKELSALNEHLYSNGQVKMNKKAWEKKRNEIIEACGGKEEMEKGRDNKNFNWKKLDKWDSRNSKNTLKMNADGTKPLLFEVIDNELPEKAVYDIIDKDGFSDGGKQYEENKKIINEILAPCRNQYTGEVNYKLLPKAARLRIQELERKNAQIAKGARKRNPNIRKLERVYGKVFDKYAIRDTTDSYKRQLKAVYKRAAIEENDAIIDAFRLATGTYKFISADQEIYTLHKWYTKVVPNEEYKDQFMELTPGDGWIDRDDSNFINTNFDESEGMSMVPKKQLYDNSKAYNKIMNSPTLKALYDGVFNTIDQANKLQTVRNYYDSYMLPQIKGSEFKAFKSTKWQEAWQYIKDNKNGSLWKRIIENPYTDTPMTTSIGTAVGATLGTFLLSPGLGTAIGAAAGGAIGFTSGLNGSKRLVQQNEEDEVFGQAITNIFSKTDDFGNNIEIVNPDFLESTGMRADGRQLNMIPIYYTRKLDNPAQITSDLIGSVTMYYDKSVRFNKRSAIKDVCESIVDHIGERKYINSFSSNIKGTYNELKNQLDGGDRVSVIDDGKRSRTYQAARKFLDMNLYDIRQDKGWGVFFSKIGGMLRQIATIINLGGNPIVAFTGFLTLLWNDMINAIVGYKYGKGAFLTHPAKYIKSWLLNDDNNMSAGKEVMRSFIKSLRRGSYIAKGLTNDVHQLLMERFNVAEQGSNKAKHSNRNRLLEGVQRHAIFGGLSLADYVSKGHVMESVLMSYKYIDGHFVTKTDVMLSNLGKTKAEIKAVMKEYDNAVSLRSIFGSKNYKLTVDEKYKDAWEEVKNEIQNKIVRYGASADGIPTSTQKAAISTSFIGSCILMHRQYLPLMIQERFQKADYNLDTQEYEAGAFRVLGKLLMAPIIDARNVAGGSIIAAPFSTKFWNTIGKEYKQEFDIIRHPGKYRDENGVPAYVYQQMLKQAFVEIAMYKCVLVPLVGYLCMQADDDDNKDKLLLQFAAFLARRLQWESFTPYRADDLFNNFKTVTAAQSLSDKAEAFCNSFIRWQYPQGSLFNTFFSSENKQNDEYNPYVDRGVYKDWYKWERDAFKLFVPYHSAYEQYYDSRSKRKYYQNQIMQLDE